MKKNINMLIKEELVNTLREYRARKNKETKVVNLRSEPYDVYIGRGSKWGNPFKIGTDGNREEVIIKYEIHIRSDEKLMSEIEELRGKRLGCFCKPKACHGDIIVKILKEKEEYQD